MIAKAGLGLIGLSAISVGGVALTKPGWLGMGKDPMPSWHSLAEDNELTTQASSYTGKFGEKHKNYLVGTTHKGTETNQTNKDWWEWAFRRWKRENSGAGKFKYVRPENGNGADALKKLCAEAYKKGNDGFHSGTGTNDDNKPTKDEVWKYCSPGKLTTISEDTEPYKSGQIGEESTNKPILISVKNGANDWFWEKRNTDFLGTESEWSGSKATANSSFKTAYDKKSNEGEPKKTIKQLCEEAYKLTKSGNESDNTDANIFCKLETN